MDPLNLPRLTKHVTDFSGVLTTTQVESFSEKLATHELNTTEQVLVVFFPHREGHELLDIGLKLFNENGIGQKNLNNGLLLIISTEEKKIRIITGKGMEIKYSEMRCRDIVENHLRPLLNEWKYEELVLQLEQIIQGNIKVENINIKKILHKYLYYLVITLFGIIIGGVGSLPLVEIIDTGVLSYLGAPLTENHLWLSLVAIFGGTFAAIPIQLSSNGYIKKMWRFIFGICIVNLVISFGLTLFMVFIPTHCTDSENKYYTTCTRQIYNTGFTFTTSEPLDTFDDPVHQSSSPSYNSSSSSYKSSSSSSSYKSSSSSSSYKSSSSSSSFGGGGGSSNGGGYGD